MKKLILILAATCLSTAAYAQTSTPAPREVDPDELKARMEYVRINKQLSTECMKAKGDKATPDCKALTAKEVLEVKARREALETKWKLKR